MNRQGDIYRQGTCRAKLPLISHVHMLKKFTGLPVDNSHCFVVNHYKQCSWLKQAASLPHIVIYRPLRHFKCLMTVFLHSCFGWLYSKLVLLKGLKFLGINIWLFKAPYDTANVLFTLVTSIVRASKEFSSGFFFSNFWIC